MKNIFLISTNEPSRLIKIIRTRELYWSEKFEDPRKTNTHQNYHLYITSNEKIEHTNWFIDTNDNTLWVNEADESLNKTLFPECLKIILTTDPKLIDDGIQPISDEFLEWFVNNPSCEFVDSIWTAPVYNTDKKYRIEFPKKELETLNEARTRISKEFTGAFRDGVYHGVYEGAKWQNEILNEQTDSFIDILLKQLDVWIGDSIAREKVASDNMLISQQLIELATRITYTQLKNFILDSCEHKK